MSYQQEKLKQLKVLVSFIKILDDKSMAMDVLNDRHIVRESRAKMFEVIKANGYQLEAVTYKLSKIPGFKETHGVANGKSYPLAKIREDLELAVPVGLEYYKEATPLPYRWVNDMGGEDSDGETFEVYLNGSWEEAQSIDWEF